MPTRACSPGFWAGVLGGEPLARDDDWHYVYPPGWTQL